MSTQPEKIVAASPPSPTASGSKLPVEVSLDKWAEAGFNWTGQVAPTDFARLHSVLSDEHSQAPLGIEVTLSKTNNVLNLDFNLTGEVWLTCQRCLNPVAYNLTGDHQIALLADESQVRLLDEEDEYLLLAEILDEDGKDNLLPLAQLIEDELLLEIPLSPKHDDCEMVVDQVGEIEEEAEESPFAALAALKGKLSS